MSDNLLILFAATGGGFLAGLVVWLFMRARASELSVRLSDRDEALERAAAERDAERSARAELDRLLAAERAAREEEKKATEDKIAVLRKAQEEYLKEMDALSRRALDQNNKTFMELAKTQFEALVKTADERGTQRKLEMEKLVEPLGKSLEDVRTQLKEVEKTRTEAYVSLTEQVKGLSAAQVLLQKEASNLVSALRKPQVRGRWGEIQLHRVVEMAGMEAFCDFDEQVTTHTDDGRLRPDMVVRLPGGRLIVVDAKVPLEAYLDATAAESDADVRSGMQRHVAQIRDHVKKLSAKAYADQFPTTPDMVVMFLPGESFYYAALQEDPRLLEYGVGSNVVVATPMTLIALLKAVAYGWRQEQLAENARRISELGQELYERICAMADHFQRVGSGLTSAVTNYNKAVGSLESRVLVSARRFRELGSYSSKELSEVDPIEAVPRVLEAADFVVDDEGDGAVGP